AEEVKSADCPLNELDSILGEFYSTHFREEGVLSFYRGKERALSEIAKKIRKTIEVELFGKWKVGDISIVELQKISKYLLERIAEMRVELEAKAREEKNTYEAWDADRSMNVTEWTNLGMLQRLAGVGKRLYADHQNILIGYYTSKTKLVAWEFAKKLASKLSVELGKMDADISSFGQKITEAITETEKLVAAQGKVNTGLEDKKGAVIEVSEDEIMTEFEIELKADKIDMPNIARQLREEILPREEFVNFGRLAIEINVEDIKDAFDIKLSEIVKTKHDEKADSDIKVLGLNILTQLQQKLKTEDDIKEFASQIVKQSGVFLQLNNDQNQLHLRNNEGNLSPMNPASINKKAILVSIPSPDGSDGLKKFADKLEEAFKNSFNQSSARTTITVNRESPRKDELSIITVSYCFPLRAIDWLKSYKERYESFLNTGNPSTDVCNAILLHSEGDGKNLPSLFAVDNAEEVARVAAEAQLAKLSAGEAVKTQSSQPISPTVAPPTMPIGPSPLGAVPPPFVPQQPTINLFLSVGGQQYGPYNYSQCVDFVASRQLTPQSMVWMEGLPAWSLASQVPVLQPLFAPLVTAPGMPPMPPTGGSMPPPMM
ncbi:MAG: DUF4339 domain-containing protein, partial [Phocaeicola sp.]